MWISRACESGPIASNQSVSQGREGCRKSGGMPSPAFVELLASGSGMGTSSLVEVESPRGAKLRLELKGMRASELAELIRAFAAA